MITDWLKNIKYGIQNLIIWFSIIWNDRWWDYNFLYRIIRFKLIQTEKKTRIVGCHVNAVRDADNIKKCIKLLDRLIENDYYKLAPKKIHRNKQLEYAVFLEGLDKKRLFSTLRQHLHEWWD